MYKPVLRPIKPEILTWFLTRELKSFEWVKDLSEEELDARIAELNPRPSFAKPLFKEQKMMFLLGALESSFIFWAAMGVGKTALALNLIKYRYNKEFPALVLVPDLTNIENWMFECSIFVPEFKAVPLIGTREQRINDLQKDGDIYIINYDGLNALLNNSSGNKISIDPNEVERFGKLFNTIIYDEMVEVKSTQSISFQVAKHLSKMIPYRYGLTGRPFGRAALDLWAQFYVIDDGATLGTSMEIFKQSFFTPKVTPFTILWNPNEARMELFHKVLQNKAIYFPPVDLPPPIYTTIEVELSEEARIYYRKLKGNLIADLKEDAWKAKIRNPFVKFRQICSGYLLISDKEVDEETGEEYTVSTEEITFDNPKDQTIEKLISILPAGKKMVIFYAFTPSGKRIAKKLDSMKVAYTWLWGQTKDKAAVLKEFKTNPKCRIMLTNLSSGAVGLNLQAASYEVFYENADNTKTRTQAESRCWRRGQEDQVYIYDIQVKNSVEKKLQDFVDEGRELFTKLIEGKLTEKESKKLDAKFSAVFKSKKALMDALGDV